MGIADSSDVVRGEVPPPGRSRYRLVVVLAVLLLTAGSARLSHGAETAGEGVDDYRAKASTLYNLVKFVDWPVDAFADFDAPIVVCVLGTDPFGPLLDDALRGRRIGSRPLVAKRTADVIAGCHVLFIAQTEHKRLPTVVDGLRGSSVLTVGEDERFTASGGMVSLLTEKDRVRLDLNREAAEKARLKISARLLTLSTPARRTGGSSR